MEARPVVRLSNRFKGSRGDVISAVVHRRRICTKDVPRVHGVFEPNRGPVVPDASTCGSTWRDSSRRRWCCGRSMTVVDHHVYCCCSILTDEPIHLLGAHLVCNLEDNAPLPACAPLCTTSLGQSFASACSQCSAAAMMPHRYGAFATL